MIMHRIRIKCRGVRKVYYTPYRYSYPYFVDVPIYSYRMQPMYWTNPGEIMHADLMHPAPKRNKLDLKDHGPNPFVININSGTKQNKTFRTALWTGDHLQVTLMSIPVGGDIGLEIHPNVDQFLRIEQGQGIVRMGKRRDKLDFERRVYDEFAIMVPAGTWHNVINTGKVPLKLYSIYAPPQHPRGTVHATKADAMAAEKH